MPLVSSLYTPLAQDREVPMSMDGYLDMDLLEHIQGMCGAYPAFCQKYELKVVLIRAATYLVKSQTQMSCREKGGRSSKILN